MKSILSARFRSHELLRFEIHFLNPTVCVRYACSNAKKPPRQKLLTYPVLKLEETMPKFLKSVIPLLTEEEMKKTCALANDFQKREGAVLQKILEKVANCEENWLAHRWLKYAYLGYRDPVTIYSSPGMSFPLTKFANMDAYFTYTAKVIMGLIKYKKQVDDGKIPVVKLGKNELDNSQFSLVYGTSRIPKAKVDGLQYNPDSKHVVVICKNNFYKLPVYNKQCRILNASVLAEQLKRISNEETEFGTPIGILTTDYRDTWAESYAELAQCETNCRILKCIQSSLFTVSLDQNVPITEEDKYNILSHQLIHGGGSKQNSANRWMDKTIQVIVNPNGISGFCYEHSPAEGQPIALMTDYVTQIFPKSSEFEDGASENYECYERLKFGGPINCLQGKFVASAANCDQLVQDLDMEVLHYKGYGKEFLKQQKLSPDSFVQVALQYAFYNLHRIPAAQYESAHLRIYYGGRTETIRSCSGESVGFAHAMFNPAMCDDKRAYMLKEAVNGHRKYTSMALQGRGVDRHLLGLKLMAIENNKPIPEFFSSPGFVKSTHFRISTSQVATKNKAFMCYGTAVKDGYSCCYNPRKNDIFLVVGSWKSNEGTSSIQYADSIREALDQMQKLLVKVGKKPC